MFDTNISVIFFYNSRLLLRPQPCSDVTAAGTEHQRILGNSRYFFKAVGLNPNITVGDYFVVRSPPHQSIIQALG